jgi:hypothetical protein
MIENSPVGSFFHVSLEEIHAIAERSGNADCILAMIALRRGQGRKANTGWGRNAIKKHMGLPHSRAIKAIDWLLENRFFKEGKRKDDVLPFRALPEIGGRIYLPNLLIDNLDNGKQGGPLGQLMGNVYTDLWSKISTEQARLDAVLVLIALYKQHQDGKARQNLVWWHWDTPYSKAKARSLTLPDQRELFVLAATKEKMQFDPEAAQKAFGKTCHSHQILPRITLAIESLKKAGLAYSLTTVSRLTKVWIRSRIEDRFEFSYILDSDFAGSTEPLGVPSLKELVLDFSEHLNNQAGIRLRPTFTPENVEFITLNGMSHAVRSTIEPVYVPNNEDLIEISADLRHLCNGWSNIIKLAIDGDLIMH